MWCQILQYTYVSFTSCEKFLRNIWKTGKTCINVVKTPFCSPCKAFTESGLKTNSYTSISILATDRLYLPNPDFPLVRFFIAYKPSLFISQDPKLMRHENGRQLWGKKLENIGDNKQRPKFVFKICFQEIVPLMIHVDSYCMFHYSSQNLEMQPLKLLILEWLRHLPFME